MSTPIPPPPCPRPVSVHIDNNGNITVNPPNRTIDTRCQFILFTFSPSITDFAASPITFPSPPPAGYDPWVGTIVAGPGPNQLTADARQPITPGGTPKKYKYDVNPASGPSLDPDIQNDPFPPGFEDEEEEGGGRPGGHHGGQHKQS